MREFLVWVCRRLERGRRLAFCGAVTLAILLGASSAIKATPMTFRFEAEGKVVLPVLQAGSLPVIPIESGDTLTGRFTFDPDAQVISADNPSVSIALAELQINVGDVRLSTDTYSIKVYDDSLVVGSLVVGPPPSTSPVFENFDGIRLGCSPISSAECQPQLFELPGHVLFRVSIQMSLLGDLSVLNTTEIPGDVDLWNDLISSRSITIGFDAIDPNLAPALYLGTVGDFVIVPEPSTVLIFVLFSSLLLFFHRDIFNSRFRSISCVFSGGRVSAVFEKSYPAGIVGMPNGRCLPFGLGIITRRTACG